MREYTAGPAIGDVHELAEGPRWDDRGQSVWLVDIARGHVFTGSYGDGIRVTNRLDFPDTTGAAVPTGDGGFAVAAHDRVVLVAPDGTRRASAPIVDRAARLRLNDAAVDPAGRLLAGSMAIDHRPAAAALFRLERDGTASVLRSGLNLANGIGWSPDGSTMYFADSVPGTLWSASYDVGSGDINVWKPLVTQMARRTVCPSMLRGGIWVAVLGGSQVRCYAPSGQAVALVRLPVPHVTAVAFVGPLRDRLLITSARDELDADERARYPDSGRMFFADVDARGLPTPELSPLELP